MIIIRRQRCYSSEFEELRSVSYFPAQIGGNLAETALDPIDLGLERVENLPIVNKTNAPKKIKRIRGIINPISRILKRNKRKSSEGK